MKNSYKEIFINELLELKKRTNILNILLNHCDKIVILKPQIEGRDIDILLINPRNINDLLTKLKNIEKVTVRYNGIDRISIVDREIELDIHLSISWLGLNILPNRYVLDRLIEIDPDHRIYTYSRSHTRVYFASNTFTSTYEIKYTRAMSNKYIT